MKIVHRVLFNEKEQALAEKFRCLGISFQRCEMLISFQIDDEDSLWPYVKEILLEEGCSYQTGTKFTERDIREAEWVEVLPDHIWGYPMPDDDFGYKRISFTAEDECPECGIGMEQVAPIRLKGEPRLGRNHFFSVNWTFQRFARTEVFDVLLRNGITGVEPMDVIRYKVEIPLQSVKQLWVKVILPTAILDDNLVREDSPCEHKSKYNYLTKGMLKYRREALTDVPDLVRTFEWFGTWHSAERNVLGSKRFVQLYLENRWRGLSLRPIELV